MNQWRTKVAALDVLNLNGLFMIRWNEGFALK
jgi:hypothetical protein